MKDFAYKLITEDGIYIRDLKQVDKFLDCNMATYEDIVLAAHYIYKEFGKNIQIELRIEKIWDTGPDQAILITRLPVYDDNIMDRLDDISDKLHLDDEYHDGWLLLTTDFRYIT